MNYIFDFDGTICDSFPVTLQIINEYLTKRKKKIITETEFKEKGIEELIRDYKLSKFQILFYIYFSRHKLSKHIDEMKSFEGLPEVIKKLSVSNRLGIVSSNSKENIEKFLKRNNLEKCFEFVYSSPSLFGKSKKIETAISKYNFKKEQTIYVGDEPRDIQAARKIGIKCIAVTWGFASKNLLKKYKPDYLATTVTSLLHPAA